MARCEVHEQRTVQRIGRADDNRLLPGPPVRKLPQPHRRKLQRHRIRRGPGQRHLVRLRGRRGLRIGEPLRVRVQRQSRGFQRPQPDLLRPIGVRMLLRHLVFLCHGLIAPYDEDVEIVLVRQIRRRPQPINGHAPAIAGRPRLLRRPRRAAFRLDPPRHQPAEIGQRARPRRWRATDSSDRHRTPSAAPR